MYGWSDLSFNKGGTNELILLHSLRKEQFDFVVPGFSDKPKRILYFGVLDRHPGSVENHEYEFILGNMSGTGAFTFPNPNSMFPFASISDTIDDGAHKGINAGDYILDVIYKPGGFSDEIGSEHEWLELGRHIRPYDGQFRASDSATAMYSRHVHIYGLRDVMVNFTADLMDSKLPEGFRQGVEYMIRENAAAICRKYDIPMIHR